MYSHIYNLADMVPGFSGNFHKSGKKQEKSEKNY